MKTKEEIIILITERIKSEYRKHKDLDWERIAAYKIYRSLFSNENNQKDYSNKKWNWMMNYCKENNLPPAQKWAWDKACNEYENIEK